MVIVVVGTRNSDAQATSLAIAELVAGVRRNSIGVRAAYQPEILASAVEMQSCELRQGLAQELSEKALTSRISGLICDLVFLADALGIDLEHGLTTELERHAPAVNVLAGPSPQPVGLDEPLSA
jgi:hypothetical protein